MSTTAATTSSSSRRASVRPWRKEADKEKIDPLIPEMYMEVGQQRLLAVSLFMLIQAFKFYDLTRPESSSFTVKYFILDSGFICGLPIFRIPWLTFTSKVVMGQALVMAIITILLFNNSVTLGTILAAIWKGLFDKELSFSGTKVRSRDVFDRSAHLSGRYTVHILPESTALLNPTRDSYCIEHSFSSVSIPVRLNSTEPIFIQLDKVNFDTLEKTSFNFTKKDIKKFKMDIPPENIDSQKLSYISLPVNSPGLYRLAKVVDSSNLDVRLYQTDVLVTSCPSAYILGTSSQNSLVDRCIGDTDTPKLVVDGVPPLKVKYSRSIKGRETLFSVQSVQPERFVSPLIHGGLPESGYIWRNKKSLDWAASKTVEVDMDTTLGVTGEWLYNIDEVEDAFGNVLNYSRMYDTREDSKVMLSKSLSYGFMVHSRPQVRFQGCDAERPVKLPKGRSIDLPIQLTGDKANGPYTVKIERAPLDDDSSSKAHEFEHKFNGDRERLTVDESGVYQLKSISGKYCAGDIIESSSCLVYVPPEPTVSVEFDEITDKCAGSIGVSADLSFTGTPPFRVSYRIIKDGTVVRNEQIDIAHSRYQMEFKPDSAGNYSYEFYSLDDSLYKGLQLNDGTLRVDQSIHALAGAAFTEKSPHRRCCSEDQVSFGVKLNGVAPFKLTYEIVHGGSKRTKYSQSGIENSETEIETPPLKSGGRYTVTLVSVEDKNGCKTSLNEEDAIIEVRRQRPGAGFLPIDGTMNVKALEGHTVGLPLRLSGEGPWNVIYRYQNPDTEEVEDTQVQLSKPNGEMIKVNRKGKYSLVQVSDAFCPGEVADTSEFSLSWYDKPEMSVVPSPSLTQLEEMTYSRKAVCEGDEDVFEIGLEGAPPFSIVYDVAGPQNRKGEKMQVATKYASVRMMTSKPGTYKYTFHRLSDAIYDASDVGPMTPISVEQVVHGKPTTGFVNKGKVYKACVNAVDDDTSVESIPIHFTGKAPYSLTVNIRHESTGIIDKLTIPNIKDKVYRLKTSALKLGLGRHTVSIAKVTDGMGCARELFNEDEKVTVMVSDVPSLAPLGDQKDDYCVGERIGFALTGVPPFEVIYEFNGKKQKATTSSPFSRVASAPGNLAMLSLSDSASSCKLNLERNVKHIHPIPSVKITDGATAVKDIHEGDQAELIFSFTGTPPFSFVYTRSEMIGKPPRPKVIETHSVTDVPDYEYSIFTSVQGIYEAISVRDAYCSVASRE